MSPPTSWATSTPGRPTAARWLPLRARPSRPCPVLAPQSPACTLSDVLCLLRTLLLHRSISRSLRRPIRARRRILSPRSLLATLPFRVAWPLLNSQTELMLAFLPHLFVGLSWH